MSTYPFIHYVVDTGLRPDPRPEAEQALDFAHEERVFGTATSPYGPDEIGKSPYFYENQWYVGSCVPHGVGLGLGIERKADTGEYVRISQLFAYRQRPGYPYAGTYLQAMFDAYKKNGAPLFSTLPTLPGMQEADATAIKLTTQQYNEAAIYKGLEYYTIKNYNDIDTLATVAAQGHGVPIILFATEDEWSQTYPRIFVPDLTWMEAYVRHCVCILPNSGFMLQGKKYVAVQDSAWFGGITLRYLPEDFIQARVVGAGYWDTVATFAGGPYPKHTFTRSLSLGATGPEVVALQKLLIAEKLLPPDLASGTFAGRTLAGLHAFQNKHASEILVPLNLDKPTDTFGSMSIAVANKLCQ